MTGYDTIDNIMKKWTTLDPTALGADMAIRRDLRVLWEEAYKVGYTQGRRAGADEYRDAFFGQDMGR